jgi:hypothetical protein
MHFLAVIKCFHRFVSCEVWVKNKTKFILNGKQLAKCENMKTLNYGQKIHSVKLPLDFFFIYWSSILGFLVYTVKMLKFVFRMRMVQQLQAWQLWKKSKNFHKTDFCVFQFFSSPTIIPVAVFITLLLELGISIKLDCCYANYCFSYLNQQLI